MVEHSAGGGGPRARWLDVVRAATDPPPPADPAAGPGAGSSAGPSDEPRLWYLTLTLAGSPVDPERLAASLLALVEGEPLATVRYGPGRVEISYWDEAEHLDDAASLVLALWSEHRRSADLPDWRPVGLEVVDRDTLHARGQRVPRPSSPGTLRRL